MYLWLLAVFCATLSYAYTTPSRTLAKRDSSGFVTTSGNQFMVNGSPIKFIGTNAYWLATLNNDADINNTLASIAATGSKVVRVWAFNDVDTIPVNGTWLQLIDKNGTVVFNTGPNGFQKLDTVLELAKQNGLYVMLSLTNNWNPLPLVDNLGQTPTRRDVTQGTNNTLPRNFLSNDYGGMDFYIRQFGAPSVHDQFYTNQTLITAFETYITQVVSRYSSSTSIFSWEIANDPRCNSSLPATSTCTTTTVTQWHSTIAQHIQSIDPNHLISSGTNGFFCADCPKLFPLQPTPPPPAPSPAPGSTRRRRDVAPVSKARLLLEQKQLRKRSRDAKKQAGELVQDGVRIRGRWVSTPTRRQDTGVGSAFDGSFGVDSEDIGNIPQVGFLSFQLFPDQNTYGPDDPNLSPLNNTIQNGINWIKAHAQAAMMLNKPSLLSGFGVVTQNNSQAFVPFNSTVAPFASDSAGGTSSTVLASDPTGGTGPDGSQPFGVTDSDRNDIYSQWLSAGLDAGINGLLQYQWGQINLTPSPGTTIPTNFTGQAVPASTIGQSPLPDTTGQSPNDGYSIGGISNDGAQQVISSAVAGIGS